MGKYKKKETNARQDFLHTFFKNEEVYEVEKVNGFILEKHWNGETKRTEVAVYSEDSWGKKQMFLDFGKKPQSEQNFLKAIQDFL